MRKTTKIKVDPAKKGPKQDLDYLPSLFVDADKIEKLCEEIREGDEKMLPYSSQQTLRAVIYLSSLGVPDKIIAGRLAMPPHRVSRMLNSDSVKLEVERLQIEHYKRDAKEMFDRILPSAVQTIFDLMTRKAYKEGTRLEAAKYLTDRALGKPKEVREEKVDMISEVFKNLYKPKDQNPLMNQPIEAEFEEVDTKSTEGDPLEQVLSDKN